MFYRLTRALFRAVAAALFRFRVERADRLPRVGAGILVAGHRSWLDPACVGAACPRPVRFLIMRSVYDKGWGRWFYRRMGTIPVPRDAWGSAAALRHALRALRAGELVGIFPEGRVVSGDQRGTIHVGAALLAVRAGVRVFPLSIRGSARAWPHGRRFPGPGRVCVRVGSPIPPPKGRGPEATREMHARIERALREG